MQVVWNCETGWKRTPEVMDKAKALLNTVDGLDRQAKEALKGCKPGNSKLCQVVSCVSNNVYVNKLNL